jgi:gliding motility-associated-like protein
LSQVLAGPGVIVSNATLNCGSNGAGTFSCACSANVSDGVILTSGTIGNALGPNNDGSITGVTGTGADPDLNLLSAFNTYDKCILEFDIFVSSDTLKFNFVFGSDEYLEYVGTAYNDVFGFFISGPGINGPYTNNSKNLAVVPGTNIPITINTVNNGSYSQYYVYNGTGLDAPYNVNPYYVQYDGLTTILQAKTVVQACNTYHLKLAIADASDQVLDSGVFLEANSVSSSGIILSTSTSVPGFPFLIEGCNTGTVYFTRTGSVAADTTFHFDIGGNAINDTDYVQIPDSITIPKNQTTASLNITPIIDGLIEGPEKIVIYIREPCTNTITDSVFLILQDEIMPQINNDTTICYGDVAQLTATGGASYSWSPTTGLSNPNIFNPTAGPLTTTTYTVTMTVASCVADTHVTVNIQPLPATNAGNDTAMCIGDTIQLNASAPGATIFKWTPTLQISGVNGLKPKIWTTVTRDYILQATDPLGCTSFDTIKITVNPLPNANAGPDKTTCSLTPVQLNASGGVIYSWTPTQWLDNPNIPNPWAAPYSTTTFKVVVTDANGCTKADYVTVTTKPLPVVNAGPDKVICQGQSTVLNGSASGSPPFTYSWQPAGLLNNPAVAVPLAIGVNSTTVFTLTVTNANGCVSSDTVTVTVNPRPIITFVPATPAICIGSSIQLVASGGATYTWLPATGLSSTTIPDPVANPTSTTIYTVTVTGANGCQNTATLTLVVNPLPVADAGPDQTICAGSSAVLTGSGGAFFSWNPAIGLNDSTLSLPTASPPSTTTYTLTVTDIAGCKDDDVVVVNVNPLPVADAGPDVALCNTATTQLNATGGVSYAWSPPTGLSDPNIANPIASPSITTTYAVTVTDANGCEDTDDVVVTVHALPVADAGPDVTMCAGASVQLNGSGGGNYAWSPPTGLSDPAVANPLANPVLTTNYVLTVTDSNGCTDNDAMLLTVNPLPVADAGPDVAICIGGSTQLLGSGGTSFQWSPSSGLSDTTIASPTAQPVVTTTYSLTVSDNNGCTDDDDVAVTVNPLPVADAGADMSMCPGIPVTFNASGGVDYAWSPATGLSSTTVNNPVANPSATTTYTVTVTDASGCVDDDDITLTVFPPAVAEAGPPHSMCPGDTYQMQGSGGVSYLWNPPTHLSDPTSASPITTAGTSMNYTLTVTDANGCVDDDVFVLTLFPAVLADAGMDQQILVGTSTLMSASGGGYYLWSPPDGLSDPTDPNAAAAPDSTTLYYLLVTSVAGCTGTDSVLIEVIQATLVDIPTAFTPNGDGVNDIFSIHLVNQMTVNRFTVYNRWGQIVFETTDPLKGWDGTYNGVPQPIGGYVYILRGTGERGEPIIGQGSVTLIR